MPQRARRTGYGHVINDPGQPGPRYEIDLEDVVVSISYVDGVKFVRWPTPKSSRWLPTSFVGSVTGEGVPYGLRLQMELIDRRPTCMAFTLLRDQPEGGWLDQRNRLTREISTGDLRKVRVPEAVEIVTYAAVHAQDGPATDGSSGLEPDEWSTLYQSAELPEARPLQLDDAHFRKVAEIYRAAARSAAGRAKPTKRVSEHFNRSLSTAAGWVMEARRRTDPATGKRFLGPAAHGRAGERDIPATRKSTRNTTKARKK